MHCVASFHLQVVAALLHSSYTAARKDIKPWQYRGTTAVLRSHPQGEDLVCPQSAGIPQEVQSCSLPLKVDHRMLQAHPQRQPASPVAIGSQHHLVLARPRSILPCSFPEEQRLCHSVTCLGIQCSPVQVEHVHASACRQSAASRHQAMATNVYSACCSHCHS